MALQQGLGLLPERRIGIDRFDPYHPSFTRQNLKAKTSI